MWANNVQISLNRGVLPHEMFTEQIRLFARDVLPRLQAHEVVRVPLAEIIARHRGLTPSSQVYRSSGCHNIAAPASFDDVDQYRLASGPMDRGGCRTT